MADDGKNQERVPLTPAQRKRLQMSFEHASRSSAKGDFKYADEMFVQCVVGDPGNQLYAQNFLANLYKYYNNNKTGSKSPGFMRAGAKGSLKKSEVQKDWNSVVSTAVSLLQANPWDVPVLTAIAAACAQLGCHDTQLVYLKSALDTNINDVEVNRLLGRALADDGQFEAAIVCWQRVLKGKPGDEEARRAIGNLTVQVTIKKGQYEGAESTKDIRKDKGDGDNPASRFTPEQLLEKAIAKNPEKIENYLELANLHNKDEKLDLAEEVLNRALDASGGDVSIRERLEDVQLRRARQQVQVAEQRAASEKTPEAETLWKQMKVELNTKELEVYRSRSERYPGQPGLKYELGLRLQRAGNHNEAIKNYQEARGDAKRKVLVLLGLAECFYAIKQYKLSLSNFEAAVAETSDRDPEQQKFVLYQTGKLSLGLKEWKKAEKYLTELAGIDFGYRDTSALLDKLSEIRDDS